MAKQKLMEVWTATGDFTKGIDAPPDAPIDEVLQAFLDYESAPLAELTPDERAELEKYLTFCPQWSVIKIDLEDLGEDGEGGWHTDGSGKRRRDCWWVDYRFDALVYKIIDRLQSICRHEEMTDNGFWCKKCGLIGSRVLAAKAS